MLADMKGILIREYPNVDPDDLKVKYSRCQIAGLHEQGYKRCSACGFMIRIEEIYCRLCSCKFRSTVRNAKRNKKWVFSEPIKRE